jgi:hypothetical protein
MFSGVHRSGGQRAADSGERCRFLLFQSRPLAKQISLRPVPGPTLLHNPGLKRCSGHAIHFAGGDNLEPLSQAWASGVRPPVPSLPRQQTSARRRRCSWPAHLRYAAFHPGPSPSRYTSASEISITQMANKRRNRVGGRLKRRFRCPCSTPPCESLIEQYPRGSVVARVFLSANPSVHAPKDQSVAHCGREKKMIQAHPLV